MTLALALILVLAALLLGWRLARRRGRSPTPRHRPTAPVEILPPGSIRSPFRARHLIIDVDAHKKTT